MSKYPAFISDSPVAQQQEPEYYYYPELIPILSVYDAARYGDLTQWNTWLSIEKLEMQPHDLLAAIITSEYAPAEKLAALRNSAYGKTVSTGLQGTSSTLFHRLAAHPRDITVFTTIAQELISFGLQPLQYNEQGLFPSQIARESLGHPYETVLNDCEKHASYNTIQALTRAYSSQKTHIQQLNQRVDSLSTELATLYRQSSQQLQNAMLISRQMHQRLVERCDSLESTPQSDAPKPGPKTNGKQNQKKRTHDYEVPTEAPRNKRSKIAETPENEAEKPQEPSTTPNGNFSHVATHSTRSRTGSRPARGR